MHDDLLRVPIWVGPIFAAILFVSLRWALPAVLEVREIDVSAESPHEAMTFAKGVIHGSIALASRLVAPWLSGLVIVLWIIAEVQKLVHRQRKSSGQRREDNRKSESSLGNETQETVPSCPNCGSRMVQRIAKKGLSAGSSFWGCSRYPDCRGTRDI